MNEPPKQRWGYLQWGCFTSVLLVFLMPLLVFFAARLFVLDIERGSKIRAVGNCRQIILCLEQYAIDHESRYPDGQAGEFRSSNHVFREVYRDEIAMDERIFGCPASPFNPDNEMGRPPKLEKTLEPGECHWMLLRSQTAKVHPKTPIVIENALGTSWPPMWEYQRWFGKTLHKRGRSWHGREIIIGRNDGSVAIVKLRSDGTLDWHSAPNLDEHGKSWIDSLTPEQIAKLEYWDIEEK